MAFAAKIITGSVMATLATTGVFWLVGIGNAQQPKPLQIGIAKTFLVDQPKSIVDVAEDDFKVVMKKTTGLDGELVSKFDSAVVADKLNGKQLDFGIFHAHDFAAFQSKYPDFRPLLIAKNKYPIERAYVIVHKNSTAKTIADLRGKKLDMPTGTNEPSRVFLERETGSKDRKGLDTFFSGIAKSSSPKDSLDEVARQKADAAIVFTNNLEFYKEVRGPVFEKNLRVLQESAEFPPTVVVYKENAVDAKTLAQFRDGLLKAHTIPDGQDMMKSWNIESFVLIPKDYPKKLAEVLKAYPPR